MYAPFEAGTGWNLAWNVELILTNKKPGIAESKNPQSDDSRIIVMGWCWFHSETDAAQTPSDAETPTPY